MSLFTKVKMSPAKGQENGRTTADERKRIKPSRSHAKAVRKTNEPKRSRSDPALEHPPDQAVAESVSQAGCNGIDLQASWTERQQSFSGGGEEASFEFIEDQIQRVWSHAGA